MFWNDDDDADQYARWEYIDKEKQRRADEERRRQRRQNNNNDGPSFLTIFKILCAIFIFLVFAPAWPVLLIIFFLGDDAMGGGGNWGP